MLAREEWFIWERHWKSAYYLLLRRTQYLNHCVTRTQKDQNLWTASRETVFLRTRDTHGRKATYGWNWREERNEESENQTILTSQTEEISESLHYLESKMSMSEDSVTQEGTERSIAKSRIEIVGIGSVA